MDNFAFVKRYLVCGNADYFCEIDEYRRGADQLLLGHLRVLSWSPSVFKRLTHEWAVFRQNVTAPIFACGEVDDDTFEHFVSLLGFRLFKIITCENGEQRRLFIHTV